MSYMAKRSARQQAIEQRRANAVADAADELAEAEEYAASKAEDAAAAAASAAERDAESAADEEELGAFDDAVGGSGPSEHVALQVDRDLITSSLAKYAVHDAKYATVRATLAALRQKSYAKRKLERAQRRERRRLARPSTPAPRSPLDAVNRRHAALVLQQVPWFSLEQRRAYLLRTASFLTRPADAVSETALRLFERKTK